MTLTSNLGDDSKRTIVTPQISTREVQLQPFVIHFGNETITLQTMDLRCETSRYGEQRISMTAYFTSNDFLLHYRNSEHREIDYSFSFSNGSIEHHGKGIIESYRFEAIPNAIKCELTIVGKVQPDISVPQFIRWGSQTYPTNGSSIFLGAPVYDEGIVDYQPFNPLVKPTQEFKVSELITLKLEGRETNIYVNGKKFKQCKFLLLNLEKGKEYNEINSIDEAAEKLSKEMEQDHSIIPPETEFWGHSSNLQCWFENDYDLRIIHTNLGLPLLRELVKCGDQKAKIKFKEQILERVEQTKMKAYQMFKDDIGNYFTKEETLLVYEKIFPTKEQFLNKVRELTTEQYYDFALKMFNIMEKMFMKEYVDKIDNYVAYGDSIQNERDGEWDDD